MVSVGCDFPSLAQKLYLYFAEVYYEENKLSISDPCNCRSCHRLCVDFSNILCYQLYCEGMG